MIINENDIIPTEVKFTWLLRMGEFIVLAFNKVKNRFTFRGAHDSFGCFNRKI